MGTFVGTLVETLVGVPACPRWELPLRGWRRWVTRKAAHNSGSTSRAQTVMILAGLFAS